MPDAIPMGRNVVLSNLCRYDSRNPGFLHPLDPDDRINPRADCACYNCCHGLDRLALEILRLRGDS